MNRAQQKTVELLKSKGFTLTPNKDHDLERVAEFTFTMESVSINEDGTVRGDIRSPDSLGATFSKFDPELL